MFRRKGGPALRVPTPLSVVEHGTPPPRLQQLTSPLSLPFITFCHTSPHRRRPMFRRKGGPALRAPTPLSTVEDGTPPPQLQQLAELYSQLDATAKAEVDVEMDATELRLLADNLRRYIESKGLTGGGWVTTGF